VPPPCLGVTQHYTSVPVVVRRNGIARGAVVDGARATATPRHAQTDRYGRGRPGCFGLDQPTGGSGRLAAHQKYSAEAAAAAAAAAAVSSRKDSALRRPSPRAELAGSSVCQLGTRRAGA
jgi:hypothetical protein